ncbi:ATP-binding protein [Ekhidna sp.]|uniref:ATP-binding protein n=1 Tax=Ekhidna sp. TaxID=2608089 RepID=UPI0032976D9B
MKTISEIKSLRRIFFLLIVSLTTLAGAAFLYILNDTKRDRINDLTYTAKVIKSYYELSFHQWELSLISLGNRLAEIDEPQTRLDYANQALEVYEKELLAFGFADPTGQVITFTGRSVNDSLPNLALSEKTRRSFEYALGNGGLTLGECYYFENVSDWILPIRVPIYNEDGEIVAVNTSAIRYSSMIDELNQFGFDPHYKVHLINNEFGTTQLLYPLSSKQYDGILGSGSLSYTNLDTISSSEGAFLAISLDPLSGAKILCSSTMIGLINHQLVISVDQSFLIYEFIDRFKLVFIIYLLLVISSIFLHNYMKRNLEKSILNLRTERANLKSIIESTSNIIGLFDKQKRLVEFNRAFNLSSKVSDEMKLEKGMDVLRQIKHKERALLFNDYFDRALNGEKFSQEIKFPGLNSDIILKFTFNPVYDGSEIVGITFFAEDITTIQGYQKKLESYNKDLEGEVEVRTKELKAKNKELEAGYKKLQSTQQQLIRAEKMASLGILSAGIGHEINNPLNFIKHGALALKDKMTPSGQDQFNEYFYAIEEGVNRASKIVNGLSHFSRTGESMEESCNIHEVLANSLALLANRFRQKNIEVKTSYNAEDPMVKGNEGKLHQVFTNIITNAEQAIEKTGVIVISTKNKENWILIEITDSGCGMSKSTLKKILDPFFTTKEPGEGTGLGLFITQMIIDEHDGQMEVESKNGDGTTFTITLNSM